MYITPVPWASQVFWWSIKTNNIGYHMAQVT